jgi:hypothetical protein
MDWLEVWTWVERYQSAIATIFVGFLGFAGVIVTLNANARLARRDREESVEHECAALSAALLAELKIMKFSLEENIDTIDLGQADGSTGLYVPTNPMTEAYDTLLPRIGLLSSRQVEIVMSAYLSMKEFRKNLSLLPGAQVVDEHRVHVPRDSFDDLRKMTMNMLARLNGAMDSLS